ncbi:MAG TPA: ATP-binding protein [Anaerolineae bacterium]|nr:ATP-binding protein [Anaerolineae bacterium]
MSSGNPLRRLSLSTLLVGINVGLLLLAGAVIAFVAVSLLQQLADDQALARVEQAGVSARNAVGQTGEEVLADAQLLSERPTLRRLLEAGAAPSLDDFLSQFQQTSQLDGTAVLLDDRVFARSGAALPWAAIWAEHRQDNSYFFFHLEDGAQLVMLAQAGVPAVSGAAVVTAIVLDESFSQQVSAEIGLKVTIRERQGAPAAADESIAARRDDLGVYLSVMPLRAPAGEVVGLVETQLPSTDIAVSLRRLIETLLLLSLAVAVLAAFISFILGRWLGRPLRALRNAAARIGHGNLATPIVLNAGGEIGTLTNTLEEMRRRLLQLTSDLRRQQAESNAIVANILEGVFTVDRERRIRYLNPQAAHLLGLDPDDVIGRFCGDVLNPQGPDHVRPCEEHCPIVHSRFRDGARATEHLLLRTGQRRTVIIASASPAEGRQQVQVIRDETEAEATRRLRDAVLANISHEFRTPLSAQLASIELLLDQLPDLTTDQIGNLVVSLQRGALRLTQLIDNLLESVRIEAGEYAVRRRTVLLDEVIEQALELTRPLLKQRDQEVSVDLPYPLPSIAGDAPRLTQVFVNLLANANKFSPAGSTVRIGGAVEPQHISVWVEDQGPGLPQPSLTGQSLFTRFVRAPAEEPDQGGVGLGLWIVKSVVERHGGRVEAGSTAAGTRMCITLPREPTGEDSGR